VALDTVITNNRLGANVPGGMVFALVNDVEPMTPAANPSCPDPSGLADWNGWDAGCVQLKGYKRPRPIVLRVNQGQCLKIEFRNLLAPTAIPNSGQTPTRAAGAFVQGLEWSRGRSDDASWVGANPKSLADPGGATRIYQYFAPEEGPFLVYSTGDDFVGGGAADSQTAGDGGQLTEGLFGAVMVQPEGAEYYRSQVTFEDLCLASVGHTTQTGAGGDYVPGSCTREDRDDLPQIDYQAVYPAGHERAGLPVLNMVQDGMLVHSDLTAIITGPDAGRFPESDLPEPVFHTVGPDDAPTYPDRLEPYREFTIIYHELLRSVQAFSPIYLNNQLSRMMEAAGDNFAINYGMGGIGSEILANRFKVGPMGECTDCKYEEFFLSSWPNGDPAMIVDVEADDGCALANPSVNDFTTYSCPEDPPKATRAYYADDPSNVYHSYLWDHTKFRILHGGVDLHHLHHLHAHQWLGSPNTSKGHYLDSQAIGPGSAFTLETVYNGGGNKNLTVGDSIFHCHFYPHFAAGMWALWRVHDVFEEGTELESYPSGPPLAQARAYPDGEIERGTPIPALVPLPTKAMAPLPAAVQLTEEGKQIEVCQGDQGSPTPPCVSNLMASGSGDYENPGYPFFIPGVGGSRAPHPPLDFAAACSVSGEQCSHDQPCGAGAGTCEALDGGLPRHVVEPGGVTHTPALNPLDFSKDVEVATAFGLPEDGTFVEKIAMEFHAQRQHPTKTPESPAGSGGATFTANGKPARHGAPYADPCIDLDGSVPEELQDRNYWAVDIQTEATYNKEGWHYPQQRMISLWGDAFDFLGIRPGKPKKPPEPFFFRANSYDCVKYRLASLVPKTYELDDFQVRTPTDILGQHIHLVKFDVTSSDGAANGWNYEDGTLGPDEVIERINAFNNGAFHTVYQGPVEKLEPDFIKFFGADPGCAAPGAEDLEKCRCEVQETEENGETHFSVKGGRWCGSQATFQLWFVDPQLLDTGQDRTMRTVFTHDHFGPSTHQQTGLYAGLVAEPRGSTWHDNQTGDPLGNRTVTQNGVQLADGGPTSWQAVIQTADEAESYREFMIEFQDTTLLYRPFPELDFPECPVPLVDGQCPISYGFCSTDLTQACSTDAASPFFYEDVCPTVDLPQPVNIRNPAQGFLTASQLEPSCNLIAGIPSKNSLFLPNQTGQTRNNVFGYPQTGQPDLSKLGWNTIPIDAGPQGLAPVSNQPGQPELISFGGSTSNFTVNYRNEPVYSRIHAASSDPNADDLAYVYASLDRDLPECTAADAAMGCGPPPDPPYAEPLTPGVEPGDPFTPLLRAYSGDDVQIRVLVGAHQNPHNFTVHGTKWLYEPTNVNSGWRNTQTMGISEHFEFLFRLPEELEQPEPEGGAAAPAKQWTDYLYKPTMARKGAASGNWGIMRAYDSTEATSDLFPLPQNQNPGSGGATPVCPADLLQATCDQPQPDGFFASAPNADGHRLRCYSVVAASVADLGFPDSALTYSTRLGWNTPNAVIYLHFQDWQALRANPQQPVPGFDPAAGLAEPLVLRAAAGDCLQVNLRNEVSAPPCGVSGQPSCYLSGQLPVAGQNPDNRNLQASSSYSLEVGLRPQLVTYDVGRSDGANVGFNPSQTVGKGERTTYYWYAGNIDFSAPEGERHIPVEFGAANLLPTDPMNHHQWGLFGAMVVEPEGSTWETDPSSRASATVTKTDGSTFRDFVLVFQDDVFVRNAAGTRANAGSFGAINYRTEELTATGGIGNRVCVDADGNVTDDVSCVLSARDQQQSAHCVNASAADPPICGEPASETPLLCAPKGSEARFRLLHPGGAVTNQVFELHGHTFAEEPYATTGPGCDAPITHANPYAAQVIEAANHCPDGDVALGPSLTEWKGSRMGHGPANHFDIVVGQAGGSFELPGDYLYRSFPAAHFRTGLWGVFRVTDGTPTSDQCPSFAPLQ
jgi:hypothetical protein